MSYMSPVYGLVYHESLVAQWLEYPTGVRRVMGSIPVGTRSDFLFTTLVYTPSCNNVKAKSQIGII